MTRSSFARDLRHDARFALRGFRRAPAFAATVVLTIALALTVLGIYGVLSDLVAQRTREIGIRVALGAAVGSVVAIVLRRSMRLAGVGLAIGALMALGATRVVGSTLVVVNGFDALGWLGGAAVVLASCLAAAWAPSRRAARVNPMEAFRAE